MSEAAELLLAVLGHGEPDLSLLREHGLSVVDLAGRLELLPLLWDRLQQRGEVDLPLILLERFAAANTLGRLRAEARRRQLSEVLEALQAQDIPVVLLKGAFLAGHVYRSAMLRPMSDLDLLIPTARVRPAMDALVGIGYTRPTEQDWQRFRLHRHPPPLFHRSHRLRVELHDTIEPCADPFSLPLPAVWARTRPIPMSGSHALALAPEDLLLHLGTHMGYSHLLGTSVLRVYDVAIWIERFGASADWDAIVTRAEASGVRRFVYAALRLAEHLLAATVPADVLRRLRREPDDVAITVATQILITPRLLPGAVALTWMHDNRWARARRFARSLLVTSTLHSSAPERRIQQLDHATRSHRYRARFSALAHLLANPAVFRISLQQAMRARYLMFWARRARTDAPSIH